MLACLKRRGEIGNKNTVAIIEDDECFAQALLSVFESVKLDAVLYSGVESFFDKGFDDVGCVVSDVRLRGLSGLQLLQRIRDDKHGVPVIMMSGFADVEMAVQSMQKGAAHFFSKPVRNQVLLDCVFDQIQQYHGRLRSEYERTCFQQRINDLTKREQEVLRLIVKGCMSKTIADRLGVSKNTVDVHRCNIMRKMEIKTVGKLVADAVYFGCFDKNFH